MISSKFFPSLFLMIAVFAMSCSHSHIGDNEEPRYTYHEFDMVFVYYKTADVETYQKLLPAQFTMPAEPMVMAFVADYYHMDARTMPYQEAAVFLLVDYEGQPAWHCVTMPVTSDEARWGGIYYLGYPKILGDVAFNRSPDRFNGVLKLKDQMVMSITLDTQGHRISDDETRMFDWLKTTRSLNILNGEVYEPKFGYRNPQFSLLQAAVMHPDKLEVKVGRADLVMDAKAAAAYSERLGRIFSIRPTEQVLAYYLKNKFVAGFKL